MNLYTAVDYLDASSRHGDGSRSPTSRIAGLLEQPLLLLPEPGQGLARGDDVEVEIAQGGGELLGRGERQRPEDQPAGATADPLPRSDSQLRPWHGAGAALAEKQLGAVGNPGR